MISCNNGFIQVKGTRIELITELACLMHLMIKDDIITKEMLLDLANSADMSEEQMHEEAMKAKEQLANALIGSMAELFGKGYTKEDILQVIKNVKEKK